VQIQASFNSWVVELSWIWMRIGTDFFAICGWQKDLLDLFYLLIDQKKTHSTIINNYNINNCLKLAGNRTTVILISLPTGQTPLNLFKIDCTNKNAHKMVFLTLFPILKGNNKPFNCIIAFIDLLLIVHLIMGY